MRNRDKNEIESAKVKFKNGILSLRQEIFFEN